MNSTRQVVLKAWLAAALLGTCSGVFAEPDVRKPGASPPRDGGAPKVQKERVGDPFRGLSPEEQKKFREAIRRAWNDPGVLQARDEVKAATIAYQKALTETIKRTDPEVVALFEKLKATPDSPFKSLFSGGGPNGRGRPGGGFRDFEAFITGESPGFLKGLPKEQQMIYRKAREEAVQSSEFREVLGKLRELRKSDEAMRSRRIELFTRVRRTLYDQLVAADERVKRFIPEEEFSLMGPPAGRRGPGGSGSGRKRPDEGKPGPPKKGLEKPE